MEIEIWKDIQDFEGLYEVSSIGEVRSLQKRNHLRLLTKNIDKEGYHHVKLSKNGKQTTKLVHRLVAEAFVPNPAPSEKLEVNHIDANKLNNMATNLEWCTHSENIRHAFSLGLIPRKKKRVVDKHTGKEFSCVAEAAEAYGINPRTLRNYLTGNIKTNPTGLEFIKEAA